MRPWVSAFLFFGVGLLLSWLGAAQVDGAWPRSTRSLNGNVMDVDTRVVSGRVGRTRTYVFQFEGHAEKFAVTSPLLPRPTSGQLLDAGHVIIDYDDVQNGAAYVVTGLRVDGRVYFTPLLYRLMAVLWGLIFFVPGMTTLGIGAMWLYRLSGPSFGPSARPLRQRSVFVPVLVYSNSEPRDTIDGEWLH